MSKITVKAHRDGYRRAGLKLSAAGVEFDTADLTKDQVAALKADPHLTVRESSETAAERKTREAREKALAELPTLQDQTEALIAAANQAAADAATAAEAAKADAKNKDKERIAKDADKAAVIAKKAADAAVAAVAQAQKLVGG